MDLVDEIENLALLLKSNEGAISKGTKKVSLTIHVLDKVSNLINQHIKQLMINNPTCIDVSDPDSTGTKKNTQIIFRLMQTITHLKLISDIVKVENTVDISEFKSVRILEMHKVDASKLTGLNSLRPQLQQLICARSIETLRGLLEDCGGDFSSKCIWAELKYLVLPYNKLISLDNSLECTPWLCSLDLSHNELTNVDDVTCLSNLKFLNISYNKLQSLPKFSGQICNRLQILNASNNILEDISQLKSLVNISELDLSENCFADHSVLVAISHMATLQWLSLIGCPMSYHKKHSQNSCSYLHSNIEPQRFILDYKKLNSNDIKLIGTFHPLMQKSNSETLSASGDSLRFLASAERYRRVRKVDIEDNRSIGKATPPLPNSYSSIDHLEVKHQIQNLRDTYGESWLNYYRGFREKNVSINDSQDISGFVVPDEIPSTDETLESKEPLLEEEVTEPVEVSIYNEVKEEVSDDDGEDIGVDSDEALFIVRPLGETDEVFLLFTSDSMAEIDCITSKERASWILDTIISCDFIHNTCTTVEVNFDTLRKDKKQRSYVFQPEEAERFINYITTLITSRKKPAVTTVLQCMKCLKKFSKVDDLSASYKKETLECPSCGSTIIVEENVTAESE